MTESRLASEESDTESRYQSDGLQRGVVEEKTPVWMLQLQMRMQIAGVSVSLKPDGRAVGRPRGLLIEPFLRE